MHKSVEGVYRDGKVELLEPAPEAGEGRVIVTFLSPAPINLEERGIDDRQACDLRRRLAVFADDWERADMDIYDSV